MIQARTNLPVTLMQSGPHGGGTIDAANLRQFLSWISVKSYHYSAGYNSSRQVKSKPSTAWPYYKAIRRLRNWAIDEGFLESRSYKAYRQVWQLHLK
jgi:hypothetical protein